MVFKRLKLLRRLQGVDIESPEEAMALLERATALSNLEIRPATVAAGAYADFWIALVDDARMVKMRARSVVIASGCMHSSTSAS